MRAARAGHHRALSVLLSAGANPNLKNKDGRTALMRAARDGYDRVVNVLLDAAADPDARHGMGLTALMFAAEGGHVEAIRALLAAGAVPDVRLTDGRTVSDIAEDHPQVLEALSRSAQRSDLSQTTSQAREVLSREP